MYLKQFDRSTSSIIKYLPFVLGFLGFMGLNLLASIILNIDANSVIVAKIATVGKNKAFFDILSPFVLLLVFLFFLWRFLHRYSIRSLTTSRSTVDWNRISFSFFLWLGINIFVFGVMFWMNPDDYQLQFNWASFLMLFILTIILVPIQTSFEEYFFRGYLLQFIAFLSKNRAVALILTSVIFGLMHMGNPEVGDLGAGLMIYYIGSGLFLGIMTLMDDGLELALGFHAANNIIGALLVTSESVVFQTDAIFLYTGVSTVYELLVQVFIIFPILLLIFSKKYNWKNWKKNLFKSL